MLYTYKAEPQAVAVGSPIVFGQNEVRTGCTVTHEVNDPIVELNRAGLYMVHFNASITGAAAGVATIQLVENGQNVPGAVIANTVTTTTVDNVAMTALVRVKPNCCQSRNVPANLQFVVGGVAVTISNVAATVTKLA